MLGAEENVVKERLAHAILELVAARAGCEILQPNTDYTSIDAIIKQISGKPGYQIDVQLKDGAAMRGDATHIKFNLKKKNYDDLRETNLIIPRMLVVAELSDTCADWVKCSEQSVRFSKSVYWIDLYGKPVSSNTSSVTVDIPRKNVLSANILAALMATGFDNMKSGKGGLI